MNNGVLDFVSKSIILLVLLISGYIMPDAVRKEICFGVRIPYDKVDSTIIKSEKTDYRKRYLLSCGIYFLTTLLIMWNTYSKWIFILGLVIFMIISYINFYISYRNMKKIKENFESDNQREYVVVDTNFRNVNSKVLVSAIWFIIPLVLAAIDFIAGVVLFKGLSDKIAVHWNLVGVEDSFAAKSFKAVFQIPVNLLIITIVLYITYRLIKRAKQQINVQGSSDSVERNRIFRYLNSAYIVGVNIIIAIVYTVNYLKSLCVLNISGGVYQTFSILFVVILMVSPLIMMLFIGQGGSRLKIKKTDQKQQKGGDRNDDKFWKLGMFYYNREDPAVMIEKRFGVGWTMNFGNTKAIVFFALIMAIIAVSSILMGK